MGIFSRQVTKAAVSPVDESHKAAAAGSYGTYKSNQGVNFIGQYFAYYEGDARNRANSVPTLSRARDLLASVISSTKLEMYNEVWNDTEKEMECVYIAPRSWLRQPDPTIPYATLMAWTLDDLFYYGRAFWFITSRTADGFPASFTRLPAGSVNTQDQAGPVWFAPSKEVYFQGGMIDPNDLVQFISPVQGIIYTSQTAIETALRVEASRYRNAESLLPSEVKLIVLGSGDKRMENELRALAAQAPEKVFLSARLDEAMSHLIEAGSDFFVMPSLFEPCGLNQMYSQIYGTVPIVSRVGGLVDTVTDADEAPNFGTGLMAEPTVAGLLDALRRAQRLYGDAPRYAAVQQRGMAKDFSWKIAALAYEKLYFDAL